MSLIAASIPAFILLIGVELWVSHRRRRQLYRFNDAVADLGCGISSQLVGLLFVGFKLAAYVWVYEHLRVLDLPPRSVATVVATVVLMDFIYYWWHRFSHESQVLWAAHVVHHQSEDYNLAVALRQAWLTSLTIFPFYLPLAWLGIPPLAYALGTAVVTLYQFWIHTELIGRLGPLEWVLNTPSHHRVHHAIDAEYLDRNYAGMFIVWDRLFGTFEPEVRRPTYGITTPLRSFNPLWANTHGWLDLAARVRAARGWRDTLRAVVAPPRWMPPTMVAPPKSEPGAPKYDVPISRTVALYVGLQLVTTVVGTVVVLWFGKTWSPALLVPLGASLVAATATMAGIVERKRWAWPLEGVRWLVIAAVTIAALG